PFRRPLDSAPPAAAGEESARLATLLQTTTFPRKRDGSLRSPNERSLAQRPRLAHPARPLVAGEGRPPHTGSVSSARTCAQPAGTCPPPPTGEKLPRPHGFRCSHGSKRAPALRDAPARRPPAQSPVPPRWPRLQPPAKRRVRPMPPGLPSALRKAALTPGLRPLTPAAFAPKAARDQQVPSSAPAGEDRRPSPAGPPGLPETLQPSDARPGPAPCPHSRVGPGRNTPLSTPSPCSKSRRLRTSRSGPAGTSAPSSPGRTPLPGPSPSSPTLSLLLRPGRRLPAGAPRPVPRPPPGAGGERAVAAAGGAARGGGGGGSAASSSRARAGGGAGRGRGPSRLAPARALPPRSGAPQGGLPWRRPRPPRRGRKPLSSGFFLSILPTHRK
uniref:LOW QUALITY PROTEIN: basic proline-rich protein-like n=1 Tax=Callithrix jacchus TaxID=9483 RepID=UPI0023DD5014